nr:zinc finger, CCHC-type [Tanacetum cinerariifolium]
MKSSKALPRLKLSSEISNQKVREKPLLLVVNFVQSMLEPFFFLCARSVSKDVRSLAWIDFASEWTWETDKGNDTTNGILRSYGINWYLVYRSAPSIQLFVHSWCETENSAGVDDPAETMQNVGVRNTSKCQGIVGSRGLRQSPVLKSSTVTTIQSFVGAMNTPSTSSPKHPLKRLNDPFDTSHEGYGNTIELPEGNNVVPLRSDTIRLVQNGCSFHRLWSGDPNQHFNDILKPVDSLDLDVANKKRTRESQATQRIYGSNYGRFHATLFESHKEAKGKDSRGGEKDERNREDHKIPRHRDLATQREIISIRPCAKELGAQEDNHPPPKRRLIHSEDVIDWEFSLAKASIRLSSNPSTTTLSLALNGYDPEHLGIRENATLSRISRAEIVKVSHLLAKFWPSIRNGRFNVGKTKVASIRDPKVKLAHCCVATTITGRKETTHRVTEIDLYYLYCIYTQGVVCNIPYWLTKYLRGVREKHLIYGGMFMTRILQSFGLLTNENMDALSVERLPHVFKKNSLIAMRVVMELHNGACFFWPAIQEVEEEDDEEEADDRAARCRACSHGGSHTLFSCPVIYVMQVMLRFVDACVFLLYVSIGDDDTVTFVVDGSRSAFTDVGRCVTRSVNAESPHDTPIKNNSETVRASQRAHNRCSRSALRGNYRPDTNDIISSVKAERRIHKLAVTSSTFKSATWKDWLEFMHRFSVFVGHEDMSAVQGETNDTPDPSAAVQTKAAQDKARLTRIIKKPSRYLE